MSSQANCWRGWTTSSSASTLAIPKVQPCSRAPARGALKPVETRGSAGASSTGLRAESLPWGRAPRAAHPAGPPLQGQGRAARVAPRPPSAALDLGASATPTDRENGQATACPLGARPTALSHLDALRSIELAGERSDGLHRRGCAYENLVPGLQRNRLPGSTDGGSLVRVPTIYLAYTGTGCHAYSEHPA